MTRALLAPLVLASCLLLGTAAAGEGPYVGHVLARYSSEFLAVMTADVVMTKNPVTGETEVDFTCTGTQPEVWTEIECWWDTLGFITIHPGAGPGTAVAHVKGSTNTEPEENRICVRIVGKPFPLACAVPVR